MGIRRILVLKKIKVLPNNTAVLLIRLNGAKHELILKIRKEWLYVGLWVRIPQNKCNVVLEVFFNGDHSQIT
jgi:hypothetical protein